MSRPLPNERLRRLYRLRATAREALAQYPVSGARVTFLGLSENATYRVDAPAAGTGKGERYLLRIHVSHGDDVQGRLTQTRAAIEAELRWLEALGQATGLELPAPVAAADGALVTEVTPGESERGLSCTLMRWVEGRRGSIGTPRMAERVGGLMAEIHRQSEAADASAYAARPHWSWEVSRRTLDQLRPYIGSPFLTREQHDVLEAAAARVEQVMAALGTEKPQYGIIHGDLHSGNLVFHRAEPRAIDFSRCGFAHYTYDIAACCMYLPPDRRVAFLGGYQRVRPLPNDFASQVEAFIMRTWLENIAFHASDPREHEWLGQLIPYLAERMESHFLAGRPFLYGG